MRIILTTCDTLENAKVLARQLIEGRLAACVSLVPGVTSIYRWKDRIEDSSEVQLVIKTTPDHVQRIKELFASNHPYEVPEFLVLEPAQVSKQYGDWLLSEVTPGQSTAPAK